MLHGFKKESTHHKLGIKLKLQQNPIYLNNDSKVVVSSKSPAQHGWGINNTASPELNDNFELSSLESLIPCVLSLGGGSWECCCCQGLPETCILPFTAY